MTTQEANPHPLLDHLISFYTLKTDAAVARRLGVAQPVISKIRHKKQDVGASMMLKIHDEFGMEIRDIRQFLKPEAV
jgi:plasmid maintenance system antidote protein VapI